MTSPREPADARDATPPDAIAALAALLDGGQGAPPPAALPPDSPERLVVERVAALLDELRRAESERQALADRYDLLMRGADDGLWDWDLQAGTINVSPRWKQMLGYEDHELESNLDVVMDRLHPDDKEVAQAAIEQHLRSETAVYESEYRLRHRDGSYRWFAVRGATLRDARGVAYRFAGAHWDITDRRLAEERLREREQQYRGVFDATSDALIIFDLETQRIVDTNPAATRMYGYSHAEFTDLPATAIIHPSQHERSQDFLIAVREGRQLRRRALNVRKDGSVFPVEVIASAFSFQGRLHLLGALRDISSEIEAYQRLEQRVEERTRELSTLLEVSRGMASTLELRPLIGLVLDHVRSVADYAGASVLILNGETLHMIERRVPEAPEVEPEFFDFTISRPGELWQVLRRSSPVIIGDVRGDEPLARAYRKMIDMPLETSPFAYVRSWLCAPLTLQERVIGVIMLAQREPNAYTPRHAELVMAIATQAAAAIENARLYEQAQELAVLKERGRLARELHDSVTQSIFSLGMLARAGQAQHARGMPATGETLEKIGTLAAEALKEMRTLLVELQPPSAEEGLAAALTKLAAAYRVRADVAIEIGDGAEVRLGTDIDTAIVRIVQESLSNAVKHASATMITVALDVAGDRLVATVTDDGAGFDPAAPVTPSADGERGGMGMRSMRDRATAAGLTLQIDSHPGAGTRVTIAAPLTP